MDRQELQERFIEFSNQVLVVCRKISPSQEGNYLRNQLFRSGTSPALNYAESKGAESRKDFKHKLKIVLKELQESHASLEILKKSNLSGQSENLESLITECNELISIMVASINTIERNDLEIRK